MKFILLTFALASTNGCATMRLLWEQVLPTKHSMDRRYEPSAAAAKADPVDESSMAANVAVNSGSENESDSVKPIITTRSKQKPSRTGTRQPHSTARLNEFAAVGENKGLDESISDAALEADHTDSSMDRLNAALSDDATQVQALPQHSLTTLEARIRVDLLIARARQLLEIRQFDQALGSAHLAQELAETAQIDFSPEEDRPIDLVRLIEEELEIHKLAEQADPKEDPAPATTEEPAIDFNDDQPKPPIQEAEKPKTSRVRRDWATLFRRDKKQPIAETEPVNRQSKTDKVVAKAEAPHESLQANFNASQPSRDGIVVANRSVALGIQEPAELTTPFAPDATSEPDFEDDDSASTRMDNSSRIESDRFDERDHPDASPGIARKSKILRSDSDDNIGPQPEFEVSEQAALPQEVELSSDESPRVKFDDTGDEARRSDLTTVYVMFGLCGLFAILFYRRGAT